MGWIWYAAVAIGIPLIVGGLRLRLSCEYPSPELLWATSAIKHRDVHDMAARATQILLIGIAFTVAGLAAIAGPAPAFGRASIVAVVCAVLLAASRGYAKRAFAVSG